MTTDAMYWAILMLLILLCKLFYIHDVKSSQQFYNVEIIIPDLQIRKTEAYEVLKDEPIIVVDVGIGET